MSVVAGELPARVLVLGLGYSGRHIATLLQSQGVACSGTVRDLETAPEDGLIRHRWVAGALEDGASVGTALGRAEPGATLLEAIRCAEAVVCTVPPDDAGDPALRLLAAELRGSPALRWVGYLSSTAVYADRDGGWIDEASVADAVDDTARRRLLAEAQWRALARDKGIASAVFRLPGIYGPGRNALVQLAGGRARQVVRPGLVFNRLHVEDLATAVVAGMRVSAPEAMYLLADDEPAPPQEVLAYAAGLCGLPVPEAQAWDAPEVSPALRRFYAGSKRIDSSAARETLGWAPRFKTYREGLQDALRSGRSTDDRR
ncbi:NAD-dependent epimerase/dehydratase family protein [Stenotrophomonas sp. ISL-67]|uniref:NAD-dependent epimerase/dehydratase family protein n=1 Tax=Stenotrophomonas sp. ISL-67 TaxID=2819171 RepID=UPI001BE7CEB3|nr:NAD-dependent epimerase/dehydratase family protein [Stenotrophomonas sp. ISL-67]MBT2768555.1 NAD-dependent epimerase/dehydratase family protein [Stenotrophomonas sp. ISL-67]